MFETYTKQSFAEAKVSLNVLDKKMHDDFISYKPDGIPFDKDWQMDGFFDSLFNSQKKEAGKKRIHFNAGVMIEICLHHFDGSDKDLIKFCLKAIKEGLFKGSMIAKGVKKVINNPSLEYRIGRDWGKKFIERNIIKVEGISKTSSYQESEDDDESMDFEDDFEEDFIDENIEEEELLNDEDDDDDKIFKNVKKDNSIRFELYKDFFDLEVANNPTIFVKKNWDYLSSLNFRAFRRREIKDDINNHSENLNEAITDYYFPKFETIFLLPELMYNVCKSQGLDVEIEVQFPIDNETVKEGEVYPKLQSIPFFKFRDLVINKKAISFNDLNFNFPKYGRFYLSCNLFFNISINLLKNDFKRCIYNSEHMLLHELSDNETKSNDDLLFKSKITKYDEFKIQDIRSINQELKIKYRGRGQYSIGIARYLSDDEYYNEKYKNFKKVFDKLNDDYGFDHEDCLFSFSNIPFRITGGVSADYVLDSYFFTNTEHERSEFYNKTGSFFDDFDFETLNQLNKKNFNLNIKNLKKGYGILPMSVQAALIIERQLAPYLNDEIYFDNFNDLYEEINDNNSYQIEILYNRFKNQNHNKETSSTTVNSPKIKRKSKDNKLLNLHKKLEKFIANHNFKVTADVETYEYEATFDSKNKFSIFNIEVVLNGDSPKRNFPFIDFKVNFIDNVISFNTKSVNSSKLEFEDFEELKDLITEEIEEQY